MEWDFLSQEIGFAAEITAQHSAEASLRKDMTVPIKRELYEQWLLPF